MSWMALKVAVMQGHSVPFDVTHLQKKVVSHAPTFEGVLTSLVGGVP